MPIGTLVNVLAIIVGSLIGTLFNKSLSERMRTIVFQGLGLCVIIIGIQMALTVQELLILVFSILLGAVTGEALNLERQLERIGGGLKKRFGSEDSRFTDGFVTASLIFCVGSMAVLGALDDGIRGDHTILFTKSVLDGVACIPLASTFGIGVAFSALPILIYQGGITLLASQAQSFFTPEILGQITAVGGVLILGIGINLLGLMRVRVTNMLPALGYAVLLHLATTVIS
ncbi:MAG: DUF554 domain-containing protein [Desulfovibrionales bacterium]